MNSNQKDICAVWVLAFFCTMCIPASLNAFAGNAESWPLSSPNGECEIALSLDASGELSYTVSRNDKIVLSNSPLGIHCQAHDFVRGLVFDSSSELWQRREAYGLFSGNHIQVNHLLQCRSFLFHNTNGEKLGVDLAASDEGVAFRYRFPETNGAVRVIESELTGFRLPMNALGWLQPYHAAGPYTPAYEDFYFHVSPGEPPPNSRAKAVGWAFPALFHIPDADSWVLLTESGTDGSYCGCHLGPDSGGGLYQVAFPLSDQGTRGWKNKFDPEPRNALPWTMPWRVIILGKTASDIAMSTLVTDLAPPSRIADTSWIKPGRASWAWWAHPDGPDTVKLFDSFTDFAVKMGWEYTLFDAGWWKVSLPEIAHYAQTNGVTPLAWCFASDFYDPATRAKKLDSLAAAGVRGVKVDFWCSDRQEAIAAMHGLFRDAAARHMVVNLHGCTIPRGWQRTWPNFLTCEAVLGTESYMFEPHYTEKAAELNTVLPFTRNAVGPMDSTPVACTAKKYARTTTAAHELANAIIINSGIIHYADKPEFFESLPAQARQIFRDAPAKWDETRCLIGEPGKAVVFARRSGGSWFIAGLNGTDNPYPIELDLEPFAKFSKRILVAEGKNAAMQIAVSPVSDSKGWQHTIPRRGGFILRLDQ